MDGRGLSAQDALWLTMDRTNNLMVIDVAMVLGGVPSRASLRRVFERLIERHPVFGRHAEQVGGAWRWVDEPRFDVMDHLSVIDLPEGATIADVQAYAGLQRSVPLDRERPLWTVALLQPVTLEDGTTGSVLLTRVHHAIADGVRLTQVMLGLLDPEFADSVPPVARTGASSGSILDLDAMLSLPLEAARITGSAARTALGATRTTITNPLDAASTGAAALASGAGMIRHPDRLVDALQTWGAADHRSMNDLTTAGKLLVGSSGRAVWTGRPGGRKAVSWSAPIPLAPIKGAARIRAVTVNDVLLGALAGALRSYLTGRGDTTDDVVWMVPVNLQPFSAELPEDLGNHFALVMLDMPLGGATTDERIDAVHQRMNRIKNSDEPVLTFGLQRTISLSPSRMATVLTDFFANKAIGVLTNVPGPTRAVGVEGIEVRQVIGFAPCSGDQPLTATIFTYAGSVTIGFASDTDLVPDPQTLVSLVAEELDRITEVPEGRD